MKLKKKPIAKRTLGDEIDELRTEIILVRREYRKNNQTRRSLAISFLKGTSSALGAIAAFVIVMPMIVWALRSVEWPPIISGVVTTVLTQIEQANLQLPRGAADQ